MCVCVKQYVICGGGIVCGISYNFAGRAWVNCVVWLWLRMGSSRGSIPASGTRFVFYLWLICSSLSYIITLPLCTLADPCVSSKSPYEE